MSETKYEVKELSGKLMVSSIKTKESQPDYFGECNIEGTIYKMSAWTNESKAGNKYLSIKFQDEEVAKGFKNDPEAVEGAIKIDS